jgi:hypothetical protein
MTISKKSPDVSEANLLHAPCSMLSASMPVLFFFLHLVDKYLEFNREEIYQDV